MVQFVVVSNGMTIRKKFNSDCFSLILYYLAGIAEFSDSLIITAVRSVGIIPKCKILVKLSSCKDADSFVSDVEAFLDASL